MLRKRLNQITDENVGIHLSLFKKLKSEIEISIQVIDSEHPIDRYQCIIYVFGFVEDREYLKIARHGLGNVFAGKDFVKFLLDRNYLDEINKSEADENDIVLYFNNDGIEHAGKVETNKRVISKWGNGHLIEHEVFEVPEKYGDFVRYYKYLDKETALGYFVGFAKHNGIPFE